MTQDYGHNLTGLLFAAMLQYLRRQRDAACPDSVPEFLEAAREETAQGPLSVSTTARIRDTICLMALLRAHKVIATGCVDEDGDYEAIDHHPETCINEEYEFMTWEADLRAEEEVGEMTYHLLRDVARWAWTVTHNEPWDAGEAMRSRVEEWVRWSCGVE